MIPTDYVINTFADWDEFEKQRGDWYGNSGVYGKRIDMFKTLNVEALSRGLPYAGFNKHFPVRREPGNWKPSFHDICSSVTFRFSRMSWPFIPLSDLFEIPFCEAGYNAFYISFIDLPTNLESKPKDLRFSFWTDKSHSIFHEITYFQNDLETDLNIINLIGSYEFCIERVPIYAIRKHVATHMIEYCRSAGERITLFV